jgi:hypothetical protein
MSWSHLRNRRRSLDQRGVGASGRGLVKTGQQQERDDRRAVVTALRSSGGTVDEASLWLAALDDELTGRSDYAAIPFGRRLIVSKGVFGARQVHKGTSTKKPISSPDAATRPIPAPVSELAQVRELKLERSGAGVEPTQPGVTRPHRF